MRLAQPLFDRDSHFRVHSERLLTWSNSKKVLVGVCPAGSHK